MAATTKKEAAKKTTAKAATEKKTTAAKKTTAKKTTAKEKTTAQKKETTAKKAATKKTTEKKTTAKKQDTSLLGKLAGAKDLLNSKDTKEKIKSALKTVETVKGVSESLKGGQGGSNALLDLGKKTLESKVKSYLDE